MSASSQSITVVNAGPGFQADLAPNCPPLLTITVMKAGPGFQADLATVASFPGS